MNKNLYTTIAIILGLLSIQGCFMYSFSGSSLPKEAKTFSVQTFQSKVAKGPANLTDLITQKLSSELRQKTSLKEDTRNNGDVQFEGTITKFEYNPTTPRSNPDGDFSSQTQLSITVQLTYSNKYDKNFEFSKKHFTQTTNIDATADLDKEESNMVEEVLKKLIDDIFNASINNW